MGFPKQERSKPVTIRLFFPPSLTALDEAVSFFAGMLERGAETNLHEAMPTVRKQLPGPTALRAVPQNA